jgi:hypothetical protein
MAWCQAGTAFSAAALYNQTACFGAHANTEAVCFRTTTVVRLESAFHGLSP